MFARLSLLATLLVSSLAADTPMTKISVEVKTLGDKPIDRASVIVDFVQGRSVVKLGKKVMTHWEVRTNQEGIAKIPELPQGRVRIQVSAKNYQTYGQVFDVDTEQRTVVVKLNPPQQQYSAHE